MKYYHMVQKGESKIDFYFYLKDGKLHIFGPGAKGDIDPVVQRRIEAICNEIGCTYEFIDTGYFMKQLVLSKAPESSHVYTMGYDLNMVELDEQEYAFLQKANEVSDYDSFVDFYNDSRFDETEYYVGRDGKIKTVSDYDDLYDAPVVIDRPNTPAPTATGSSPYSMRRRKLTTEDGMLLGPAFDEADTHRTDDFFVRTGENVVISGYFHGLDIREIKPKEDSKAVQKAREKGEEPKKRYIITGHIVDDYNSLAIKRFTSPSEDGPKLLKISCERWGAPSGSHY